MSRPFASFGDPRLPVRLWRKVQPCPMSGCWLWVGSWTAQGYGNTWWEGYAGKTCHRLFYETLIGSIPEGLHIDHLCRVRCCVNPLHLEPVTCWENTKRGNNMTAVNVSKTHCPKGHPYDEKNTRYKGRGRECRKCGVVRVTEYRRRKRGESHVV